MCKGPIHDADYARKTLKKLNHAYSEVIRETLLCSLLKKMCREPISGADFAGKTSKKKINLAYSGVIRETFSLFFFLKVDV